MIKETEIDIKIGTLNYKHFYEKYGPFKKTDIITVKIEDVLKNSKVKVTAICDICKAEIIVSYQNYNIQSLKSNYYCCKKCKNIKTRESNKEKYGIEHTLQRNEVKEKSKSTLMKKYNIKNISQRPDIKKIRSERLLDQNYQNNMLNGVISKFGIDNVSKLESIKCKKEQTLMLNYGVTNPSQSPILFERAQKNGKRIKFDENTKLYYRGTYELNFLNFCYKNNIKVEKGPTISFLYNNKNKVYHSDFILPEFNLICEIKSNYYYNKYLDLNLIKEIETLKQNYIFIFIIDKNYTVLKNILNI